MYCNKCFEFISGDCLLTDGTCVFCHYNTDSWDTNGRLITKKESILNACNFFESFLDRCKEYLVGICSEIDKLPKGAVVKKKIKGKVYYYLVKRKNGKVVFEYFGKDKPEQFCLDISRRNDLIQKKRSIQKLLYSIGFSPRKGRGFNRFDILRMYNFTCQYCGKTPKDGIKLHIDHIKPLCKMGSDDISNLTVACESCNLQKSGKL